MHNPLCTPSAPSSCTTSPFPPPGHPAACPRGFARRPFCQPPFMHAAQWHLQLLRPHSHLGHWTLGPHLPSAPLHTHPAHPCHALDPAHTYPKRRARRCLCSPPAASSRRQARPSRCRPDGTDARGMRYREFCPVTCRPRVGGGVRGWAEHLQEERCLRRSGWLLGGVCKRRASLSGCWCVVLAGCPAHALTRRWHRRSAQWRRAGRWACCRRRRRRPQRAPWRGRG